MPKVSHSSSHTHNHSPILGGTDPQSVTQRPTLTGVTENTEAHYTDRTRRPVVSKHKSVQRQSHTQTAPPEHSITVTDVHSFTTPSHTVAQSHLSAQDRTQRSGYPHLRPRSPVAQARCRGVSRGPLGNVVLSAKRPRRKAFWGSWSAWSEGKAESLVQVPAAGVYPAELGVPRASVPAPLRPAGDSGRRRRRSRVAGRVSRASGAGR